MPSRYPPNAMLEDLGGTLQGLRAVSPSRDLPPRSDQAPVVIKASYRRASRRPAPSTVQDRRRSTIRILYRGVQVVFRPIGEAFGSPLMMPDRPGEYIAGRTWMEMKSEYSSLQKVCFPGLPELEIDAPCASSRRCGRALSRLAVSMT